MCESHILEKKYELTAAQCNVLGELSLSKLIQQLIELATCHADILGIGFERLAQDNILWVLSRVVIKMEKMPQPYEPYTIVTWVENYGRISSDRDFQILNSNGDIMGECRTTWLTINKDTRRASELPDGERLKSVVTNKDLSLNKSPRIRIKPDSLVPAYEYTVRQADIDINEHLTSSRYVDLLCNIFTPEQMRHQPIHKFEIEYKQEVHYGSKLAIGVCESAGSKEVAITFEGTQMCVSRFE